MTGISLVLAVHLVAQSSPVDDPRVLVQSRLAELCGTRGRDSRRVAWTTCSPSPPRRT